MPLSSQDEQFLKHHLEQTSRTFAPGIAWLRPGLRESVSLAYLLCRILDTIEDSADMDSARRIALLESASTLTFQGPETQAWANDCANFFADEEGADAALCQSTPEAVRIFQDLPESHRAPVIETFHTMARGMAGYVQRAEQAGGLGIESYQDLRDYCYFVAGTVGEMLSRLFIEERNLDTKVADALRERDVAFGIGLQIVNIIKGVSADFKRQATFVPNEELAKNQATLVDILADDTSGVARTVASGLTKEALSHLDQAIAFTLELPEAHDDIRAFCAFPIIMALRTCTLAMRAEHVFPDDNALRIPRPEVMALLAKLPQLSSDNSTLGKAFEQERQGLAQALEKVGA